MGKFAIGSMRSEKIKNCKILWSDGLAVKRWDSAAPSSSSVSLIVSNLSSNQFEITYKKSSSRYGNQKGSIASGTEQKLICLNSNSTKDFSIGYFLRIPICVQALGYIKK